MSAGLMFTVNCVECDGQLEKLNGAQRSRYAVCAVLQCIRCGREYVVDAHLSEMRHA